MQKLPCDFLLFLSLLLVCACSVPPATLFFHFPVSNFAFGVFPDWHTYPLSLHISFLPGIILGLKGHLRRRSLFSLLFHKHSPFLLIPSDIAIVLPNAHLNWHIQNTLCVLNFLFPYRIVLDPLELNPYPNSEKPMNSILFWKNNLRLLG